MCKGESSKDMRFRNRKKPQSRKEHDMHTGCNGSAKITGIEQLKMHFNFGFVFGKKNNQFQTRLQPMQRRIHMWSVDSAVVIVLYLAGISATFWHTSRLENESSGTVGKPILVNIRISLIETKL